MSDFDRLGHLKTTAWAQNMTDLVKDNRKAKK